MHLPHLRPFDDKAIIFLTVCAHDRRHVLATTEAHALLHNIWEKSATLNGWFVGHYLLMPDHVPFFACSAPAACSLADWMRLWKSIGATRINKARQLSGPLWQADYFDRFVRSLADYDDKWDYIALNPGRKGLVAKPEDCPYRGVIHDLRHHASRG